MTLFARVQAEDCACSQCGSTVECCKVCRLVEEEKKITTTCWGLVCEEYCVPGPSERGCQHCEMVCEKSDAAKGDPKADPKNLCARSKKIVWTEWIPGCSAKIATKKKLMKKTVTKKVPSYKWVVEDLCPACEAKLSAVEIPTDAEIPPTPAVEEAKLIPGVTTSLNQAQ
ncbi:MAG: hypothetical protein ACKVT0_24105 [Planctomycetaceae bacterium]